MIAINMEVRGAAIKAITNMVYDKSINKKQLDDWLVHNKQDIINSFNGIAISSVSDDSGRFEYCEFCPYLDEKEFEKYKQDILMLKKE